MVTARSSPTSVPPPTAVPYELGRMIQPQLKAGDHGAEVAAMFSFDENTYALQPGEPIGERPAEVAEDQNITLMVWVIGVPTSGGWGGRSAAERHVAGVGCRRGDRRGLPPGSVCRPGPRSVGSGRHPLSWADLGRPVGDRSASQPPADLGPASSTIGLRRRGSRRVEPACPASRARPVMDRPARSRRRRSGRGRADPRRIRRR